MNGAFGGKWDVGEAAQQSLADFPSAPTGMLTLHAQDVVLHLKGQLIGIAIRTPTSVGEPLDAAFLIAIEDLVPGLARDPELSAQIRHCLAASRRATNLTLSSITEHSFHGIHFPPRKGRKCNLCVRYDLLPMSRVAQKT